MAVLEAVDNKAPREMLVLLEEMVMMVLQATRYVLCIEVCTVKNSIFR